MDLHLSLRRIEKPFFQFSMTSRGGGSAGRCFDCALGSGLFRRKKANLSFMFWALVGNKKKNKIYVTQFLWQINASISLDFLRVMKKSLLDILTLDKSQNDAAASDARHNQLWWRHATLSAHAHFDVITNDWLTSCSLRDGPIRSISKWESLFRELEIMRQAALACDSVTITRKNLALENFHFANEYKQQQLVQEKIAPQNQIGMF